jgi:hypothetical protein
LLQERIGAVICCLGVHLLGVPASSMSFIIVDSLFLYHLVSYQEFRLGYLFVYLLRSCYSLVAALASMEGCQL